MRYALAAIALAAILIAGGFGKSISAVTNTSLRLDSLSGFPVTQGETLIFSGRLIKATTLAGLGNVTINIMRVVSFDRNELLISGQTDADGYYSIPWTVDVEKVVPQTGGSFGTESTQGREKRFQVKVFAQFVGDDEFGSTVSNAQSFEVRLNQIKIFVDKKPTYLVFESFSVGIRVTDVDGNMIDPDTLSAEFDNQPITAVRNDVGLYSFTISSLTPGSHSLKVIATKKGHVTDDQLVTIEGMKRRTSLVINTDKKSYEQGETVAITIEIHDVSTGKFVQDQLVTAALTTPKLRVVDLKFVDGKATYQLTEFDPPGSWSISANFVGDEAYFRSSASASFTVEKGTGVIRPPPVEEKVTIGPISLVDQQGNRLRSITVGDQVMIQAKITSNFDTTEEVAYISQVRDADGVTVALSWVVSTVSPDQTLELAISWLPDNPGEYTAEVFVWKDIRNPEPLSFEVKRSPINVKS
jgi:hypothetical protein